jgi:6-phosphogluconolactonase (cycloisomerase 2 family)
MRSIFFLGAVKAVLASTGYTNVTATTVNLFVSSYDGTVTTFCFDRSKDSLKAISQSRDCGLDPSWLVYDKPRQVLYCMDESTPSSLMTAYNVTSASGVLTTVQSRQLSTAASVSGVLFGDNKFMAVAGYSGHLSVLSIHNATMEQIQVFEYVNKTKLGPHAQQTGPHPHQAIVDPTGKFVVVPDLGGDLLRVFAINTNTVDKRILLEKKATATKPGSGPRHAVFWKNSGNGTSGTGETYLFVVFELTNTVSSYKVTYLPNEELELIEMGSQSTFGGGLSNTAGAAAAEIQISPDNRFVVVSNRNLILWQFQRQDESNRTWEETDSLSTFAIEANGTLSFKQIWPAFGLHPRHFAMNKAGDRVAVTHKNSCRLHILDRDPSSGLISWTLAEAAVGTCAGDNIGGPTMVVWDE